MGGMWINHLLTQPAHPVFLFVSETRSCFVAQAGLECIAIPLPLPPKLIHQHPDTLTVPLAVYQERFCFNLTPLVGNRALRAHVILWGDDKSSKGFGLQIAVSIPW